MATKKTRTIGIIGTIASGKDAAAEYLSAVLSIPAFQISAPLKDLARQRGMAITRDALIQLGRQIASEFGEAHLAKLICVRIEQCGIITGMRQLEQIRYLRDSCDFVLLAIEAPAQLRFERVCRRNKEGEAKTLSDFVRMELDENKPPHVQRLFECLKLADYTIVNDRTLDDLHKELALFLSTKWG